MSDHTPVPFATVTVETLPVLAHQGLPVITTGLLAQCYGTEAKNIRMNFANNAERFESGKHFFKLEGEALRAFKHRANQIGSVEISGNVNAVMLWTERGAARHAKMLDTDQAWEVFERLEDAYFRIPGVVPAQDLTPYYPEDPRDRAMAELLAVWFDRWPTRALVVEDVVADTDPRLGSAIVALCGDAPQKELASRLGYLLRAYRGREMASLRLGRLRTKSARGVRWIVERVGAPSAPALPPTVKEALTVPGDPIAPEVRRAIDRKAHALSLEAFEFNRRYLERWVSDHPGARNVPEALDGVHPLDLGHKKYILVDEQDLIALSDGVVFAEIGFSLLSKSIGHLRDLVSRELGSTA